MKSWGIALGFLSSLAVAGCTTPLAVEGAPCPCPGGYVCDPVSGRCSAPGAGGGPPTAIPDASPPPTSREGTVCVQPGPAIVRPLSAREYQNTVADLLSVTIDTSGLPPDSGDLPSSADPPSSPFLTELAGKYLQLAEAASHQASANLSTLLPCPADMSGETTCARQFADSFGQRAFRRPLTPRELDDLVAVFDEARRTYGGVAAGYRRLIQQILASQDFYLRKDLGESSGPRGGPVPLTPWEIATRLSYFLWGTTPDDELRAQAAAGALRTKAGVQAQAERLLASPRADATIADFHRRWLQLERVRDAPKEMPEFSAELRQALITSGQETALLGQWRRGGNQAALFEGPLVGNRAMSDFYALSAPTGAGFEALQPLGTQRRFGFLTLPALMSSLAHMGDSSPVQRGGFVLRRFMCKEISVPANIEIPVPAERRPGVSARERFAQHSMNPTCWSCHSNLDPIGFALENYDGYGRWREYEDGRRIDVSSGEVGNVLGMPFDGPHGLAELLGRSEDLPGCLARQWFSYAMGRAFLPTDDCTIKELTRAYQAGGGKLRPLLIAIVRSDAFLTRKAP